MEVSKSQKISFKIVLTCAICLLCLMCVAPQSVEAGFFKKAWGAIKSGVSTVCKAVTGIVKGAVDFVGEHIDATKEPETVESAISFEDVGEIASIYFSTNSSPDAETGKIPGVGALNKDEGNNGVSVVPGNAGVFVSYGGKSWLTSLLTMATTSSSYDTYANVPVSSSGSSTSNVVYDYACYGAVLATAGLDKTGYEVSAHLMNIISGGVIYLLYLLSIGLDSFFSIIFDVLIALNPFTLFYKGTRSVTSNVSMWMNGIDTSTTAGATANNAFAGLTTYLGKWYKALYNFSWQIIVPAMFVCLAVSVVLFRHTGKWKNQLKKYIIRVAFLVIGVPLFGGIYTKALTDMKSAVTPGASPVTKLIISTFVDFESWAEHGRLSLAKDDGVSMALGTSTNNKGVRVASGFTKLNVRNIAFQINKAYAYGKSADRTALGDALFADYGTGTKSSSRNTYDDADLVGTDNMSNDDVALKTLAGSNIRVSNNQLISVTTDILKRYMDGKYYTSGEYEALAKAQLTGWANTTSKGNHIIIQFITIEDLASWYVAPEGDCYTSHKGRLTDVNHFGNEIKKDESHGDLLIETQGTSEGINVYANGALKYTTGSGYSDDTRVPTWSNSYGADATGSTYSIASGYGLSSCSMYNYLNTAFTTSSVTCYSPSNIASTFIRKSHFSVNIVGTGVTSFLYWLNCLMMILCYVVVGYFYAIGMMFSNISRMFQVIKAVPFAMLGAIKSIAEVITYAFVMIIEVIMTVFLFEVVIEIMFSMPDIFTGALAEAFNISGSDTLVNWGMPVILAFLVLFYGWFMVKALKMRKKFIKSLSEAAEEIVDKFIGVKTDVVAGGTPGMASGKSVIGGALGGAAAGIGAAAAGNFMAKDAAKNEDAGDPNDDGSNGGNGIVAGPGGGGGSVTNSDTNIDNSDDSAQIDNKDSKMDALDKKEADAIGTSLGDKKDKKSIGERLGESKEERGINKEVKGLNKEADGLEKEAKGEHKKDKGEKKLEASKDLKNKAVKDAATGAVMASAGKAAMHTPGMRLAGAGLYAAGKMQQVKSAGELAAAKMKEVSGKHDVKSGDKIQAKGQKMQVKGQEMQKKGVKVQTNGQTKQLKAQGKKLDKAYSKADKAEQRSVKTQESASVIAKRSQAENLRTTANSKVQANNSKPSNMSGKQAKAQQVQSQKSVNTANNVGSAPQQRPQPQKQSLMKAAINGAKQGANQAMANRSDDGSIRQQYFQGKANGYAQNQQMANYHQRYGSVNVQQTQAPARPVQQKPQQQTVKVQQVQQPQPKAHTQTVKVNQVVQQKQQIIKQQEVIQQTQQTVKNTYQSKTNEINSRQQATKDRRKNNK